MTGLRARQKAERKQKIEQAAKALVEEKGFTLTTIEEVAAKALVSPATVYNYYGNKGELLLALVAKGEEGTKARLSDVETRAGNEAPEVLLADIICSNMRDTLAYLSREVWGHVVAYVATTPDPQVGPRYMDAIADDLANALACALTIYMKRGILKELDADRFAYMMTRLERNHFLGFIYQKSLTEEDLYQGVREEIAFLIEAIKP
ncbi:TetR family transcriptional regulator [Kordiimonas sediminis]|uniref:TetR family transcriptional regulator n=1 Tax=Kordiimonas sediminis TaxID=1735581 RepID=A0A919E544_9PROT|nr:TetR/AcrR family transcriptional regulator [Kordiimonas sediminis]GHF14825.1 TetR family transcriptional regulator [Kordiimonas sediminis]